MFTAILLNYTDWDNLDAADVFIMICWLFAAAFALKIIIDIGKAIYYERKKNTKESWRESNGKGSFTIYERNGLSTVARTYTGGERYIDGHLIQNADDMEKWNVLRGHQMALERRLYDIEYLLKKEDTDNGDALYREWLMRYDRYRTICISTGMWNWVVGDRKTFVPTSEQIAAEDRKKKETEQLFQSWKLAHDIYAKRRDGIIRYLESSPRKHAIKSRLVQDLSCGNAAERKELFKVYKKLKAQGVIGDKEIRSGVVETRIIIHRKKPDTTEQVTPSAYFHSKYMNIPKRDYYKTVYTVGSPENVDKVKNTCSFTSLTDGTKYYTSLEKCSCPAYERDGRCKHMIKLALHLGYLHETDFE